MTEEQSMMHQRGHVAHGQGHKVQGATRVMSHQSIHLDIVQDIRRVGKAGLDGIEIHSVSRACELQGSVFPPSSGQSPRILGCRFKEDGHFGMAPVVVSSPPVSSSGSAGEIPLLPRRMETSTSRESAVDIEASTPLRNGDDERVSEASVASQRTEGSLVVEHSEASERSDRGGHTERLERADRQDGHTSPRAALASYTDRLNVARVRAEFESSLLIVLTLNVLYTYYVDHKLIILFIRASQVVRLLYYPYSSESAQRGTALLVLISNVAVLFIHAAMIAANEDPGRMLFINFIGPEPKSPAKIVFLDVLIILFQSILMQCRLEPAERLFLTKAPVPAQRVVLSPPRGEEAILADVQREDEASEPVQNEQRASPT